MQPTDRLTGAESDGDVTALQTGYTLGRYRIVSILGQGAFGTTYRAYDTQLDCDVAIKEFFPNHLAARQGGTHVIPRSTKVADDFLWGRDKFLEEGKTLASLRQAPAIVRILDFLEANGTAYIIMEMLKGETLESHMSRRGRLPYEPISRILSPLLDGLERVHAAGFLHRDIKPANILLDSDGNPTLIDFGASRSAMVGRTQVMTAIFTPGYAAAEQFTSARQGPWTDIYSLSATLYQAITGSAPPSAIERMLDDEYVPLTKRAPTGFPSGVLIGLDAGLAVRASDRPQSVAGWRFILGSHDTASTTATVVMPKAALASARRLPSDTSNISETPRSAPRSKSLWLGAATVAVLAMISGGYFVLGWSNKTGSSEAAITLSPDESLRRAREALAIAEEAARRASEEAQKREAEEQQRREAAEAAAKRAADESKRRAAEEQLRRAEAEAAALKAAEEAKQRALQEQRQKAEAEALAKQRDDDARRAAQEELRRRIEAEAAEKRRVEEETRRAQEALAAAEAARRQAEAEELRLRLEAEAAAQRQAEEKKRLEEDLKRKAEAEAVARRAAEEAAAKRQAEEKKRLDEIAKQKAEAEAAAKQRAEEKKRLEEEARQKAEAEAAKKQQAENDRKAAEAVELGLRLGLSDRQKIQVAITSLGFDTRGTDGVFGPRSREMIAAWQQKRNYPPTGYLTSAQVQALLREAASAIAKYEDDQKKLEEEKKKADDLRRKAETEAEAKAKSVPAPAAPPVASAPAVPPPAAAGSFDGTYRGTIMVIGPSIGYAAQHSVQVNVQGGLISGQAIYSQCGNVPISLSVSPSGAVSGKAWLFMPINCGREDGTVTGRINGNRIELHFQLIVYKGTGSLSRQ